MAGGGEQIDEQYAGTISRVDANIHIGGYLAAADSTAIRTRRITHIVKMFADDASYRGGMHRHPGVEYLVIPAIDHESYDIAPGAAAALRFIAAALAADPTAQILVHCHAGISRSATVVILHLMVSGGMSFGKAFNKLAAVRPFVRPNRGFATHMIITGDRLDRIRADGRQAVTADDYEKVATRTDVRVA